VSPILVRPVREQLEHDRLIRHLEQRYKRKFEVALNLGDEQAASVKFGTLTLFPDLVLTANKKLAGVVEVETGESVNNLEAMAQWAHFGRARVPFHLYIPVTAYETARRLCEANHAKVAEVWTYRPALDGFDLVRMTSEPTAVSVRLTKPPERQPPAAAKPAKPAKPAPKPAVKTPPKAAASRSRGSKAAKPPTRGGKSNGTKKAAPARKKAGSRRR
jgi:hypothetical protein